MDGGSMVALAGLALLDSTSFGTLAVPVLFLLRPRLRLRNLAVYLLTLSGFYFLLGLALLAGATSLVSALGGLADHPALDVVQLAVGVGLVAASEYVTPKRAAQRRERAAGRSRAGGQGEDAAAAPGAAVTTESAGLPARWRERALGDRAGVASAVVLALVAGLVEAASMLPYLAAVGILTASAAPLPVDAAILAGYVLVMALPAIVLTALRLAAGHRADRVLGRLNAWLGRHAGSALSWVLGIVGVLLCLDAISRLLGG